MLKLNVLQKLLFLLLNCFILSSCSLRTTKNLTPIALLESSFENKYFYNPQKDYVYKAKIEAFGKYFGGILAIKKLKSEHHRIAFTTEFGAKIFDFEFEKANFKVNYILSDLDRKIILNNLRKNFQLLLKNPIRTDKKYMNATHTVYRSKFNRRNHFYFFSNQNGSLEKLIQTSKFKEKVSILFESKDKEGAVAQSIEIAHQQFPLKIELKAF